MHLLYADERGAIPDIPISVILCSPVFRFSKRRIWKVYAGKQVAEKVGGDTSGAEAQTKNKGLIAAVNRCATQKRSSSAKSFSKIFQQSTDVNKIDSSPLNYLGFPKCIFTGPFHRLAVLKKYRST